jgi:hypothetical protein
MGPCLTEVQALRFGARLAQTVTTSRSSIERSGWWVKTPTRVGTRAHAHVYLVRGDRADAGRSAI